ncbi:hypothetical protein H2200_008472 [Cladophialophora chaetospira]|uniref:Sphingoid long-chain base transporter RSB1 n=1 Tax=Cladophialophora chaetospira TaxID=386627 RepID=A0AA38X5Y2_9EURO|nr:hypothetical protein H2200_008472 [Cladophialophora chaetospira]
MSDGQPRYISPNGTVYIAGGKEANCTLAVCPVEYSVYGYRPSIAASTILIGLYALCMLIQMYLGRRYKAWGYMSAILLGCIDEILGYVGRILLWQNPWNNAGFIMQIDFLQLNTRLIYGSVVYVSIESSRLRPNWFYYIFIPCDIVSLILQAAGGALSSTSNGSSDVGVNVALAGLGFQVFTLAVFSGLVVDYAHGSRSVWSRVALPRRFLIFIISASLATILIFVRCCYRLYELNGGYSRDSKALRDENLFIGLESV